MKGKQDEHEKPEDAPPPKKKKVVRNWANTEEEELYDVFDKPPVDEKVIQFNQMKLEEECHKNANYPREPPVKTFECYCRKGH